MVENSFISETGKKQVSECVVGDETATILLKARGKECDEITAGRSLLITACKVDMYHGSMRLVLDLASSTISEGPDVKAKVSVFYHLVRLHLHPTQNWFVKCQRSLVHATTPAASATTDCQSACHDNHLPAQPVRWA